MNIKRLVLDTNYFVNRSEIVAADQYYTTKSVVDEIKDEESRKYFEQFQLTNKLEIMEPDTPSIQLVRQSVEILNAFAQLSQQDMGVIALAVTLARSLGLPLSDLQKIDYSQFELQESTQPVEFEEITESEDENEQQELQAKYGTDFTQEDDENLLIAQQAAQQTYSEDGWVENKRRKKVEIKKHYAESAADFGNGEWITKDNVKQHLNDNGQSICSTTDELIELGIFTEDRGMQNLILALGLKLVNSQRFVIEKVKHFALKCSSCKRVFFNSEDIFQYQRNAPFLAKFLSEGMHTAMQLHCPHCSNVGLMRVAVYIQNGKITTTKGIKHFNLQGTVYNLADLTKNRYSGYKKSYLLHPELYEEHLIKQCKYQTRQTSTAEFGDDLMKGVAKATQNSDVAYFLRKNPNVRKKKLIIK